MSEYKFVFKITNEKKARMDLSGTISASAKDAILTILMTADIEDEIKKLRVLRKLVEGKKDE